jgi:hypothetical protein
MSVAQQMQQRYARPPPPPVYHPPPPPPTLQEQQPSIEAKEYAVIFHGGMDPLVYRQRVEAAEQRYREKQAELKAFPADPMVLAAYRARVETIGQKLQTGTPLTWTEQTYLAKIDPETFRQYQAMQQLKPTVPTPEPSEQPKSVAQQILEMKKPPLRQALENLGVLQKTPFDPLAMVMGKTGVGFETGKQAVAAAVGVVESPVYAVGRLIGVKGVPEPPVTATGGLLSTLISKEGPGISWLTLSGLVSKGLGITPQQKQILKDLGLARKEVSEIHYTPEMQYLVEHPAYAVGSVLGEVALAYGISKGFGYAKGKISEFIHPKPPSYGVVDVPRTMPPMESLSEPTPATGPMPKDYLTGFDRPESALGLRTVGIKESLEEGYLLPESKYPPYLTTADVSSRALGPIDLDTGKALVQIPITPKSVEKITLPSYARLKAEATAMELGIAPKTAILDPLAELIEPPTLLRPISGMPYMPTPELTAKIAVESNLLGLVGAAAAVTGISTIPRYKGYEPTSISVPKLELPSRLKFDLPIESGLAERVALSLRVGPVLAVETIQKTALIQETKQVQQLRQDQVEIHRQIQKQTFQGPTDDYTRKLLGTPRKRKGKLLVGRWEREWQIWSPQKMLRKMVGVGRNRKVKRK